MKIGVMLYPTPDGHDQVDAMEWLVGEAGRLGINIFGGDYRPLHGWDVAQYDQDRLRHIRGLADANGVEIEPYVRAPFDLTGPDAAEAIEATRASIRVAKLLGGPYLRTGYGRLKVESSRFNRDIPVTEHLARLTASLRIGAQIAADEGVVLAVENHCDFTGGQIAEMVATVDSPAVRAALDTGNSVTVFSDPTEDLRALAPYVVTTHLKDMQIVPGTEPGDLPFQAVGAALGEGHVDIAETVRLISSIGPRGADTPWIVELGWLPAEDGVAADEVSRRAYARSIEYLRGLEV